MNIRTDERKNENGIPVGIKCRGYNKQGSVWQWIYHLKEKLSVKGVLILTFTMGNDPFGNGSVSSNTNSKHW